MNKVTAGIVILAGLVAVGGLYWFRANRLTAADLEEMAKAQDRVAHVSNPSDDPAASHTSVAAETKAKENHSESATQAPAANSGSTADKTDELPPAVTIIPIESMPEKTPEKFTVLFKTTKGPFAVEITRDWAPHGADRIYDLVRRKFFTDMRIFRVVQGFVVQFGIPGDPAVSIKWYDANIPDDPPKQSNTEGMFTFAAGSAPNTRATQVFVNLGDNSRLDRMGFAPVGKVIFGMDVVKSFYSGYGEQISSAQEQIFRMGNAFLDGQFPGLDSIKQADFIDSIEDTGKRDEERPAQATGVSGIKPDGSAEIAAPEKFKVKFDCTMGTFVVECDRSWSPNGADRLYLLVKNGFFDDSKFFRFVPGYVVQFGLPADPAKQGGWVTKRFPDDPFTVSNTEGTIAFAKPGKMENARSTQVFINLQDNSKGLDAQGFTPIGKVIEGMDVVKKICPDYGEKPQQASIRQLGNVYLNRDFPALDGIRSATIVEDSGPTAPSEGTPAATVDAPAEAPAAKSPGPETPAAAAPPSPASTSESPATPAETPKQ